MNIFILDENPQKSAEYHNDKHVVKMILESAQLLSTVIWEKGQEAPYKPTHRNHPCTKWVLESKQNYLWLVDLAIELCNEYTERYGKYHKSEQVILYAMENMPELPNIGLTPFALAMPEQYKSSDPVKSYRDYYMGEKRAINSWKTKTPSWYE